jgi:hypothetical protein
MAEPLIDLVTRTGKVRVARAAVHVVVAASVLGCCAWAVSTGDAGAVRSMVGGTCVLAVLAAAGVWWTVRTRLRWMGVDHEGLRLLNRRRAVLTRIAWTDLAGIGVLTNEAARRRRTIMSRYVASVPTWLELFPAGRDALGRHPELHVAWRLGAPRRDGDEQRWLIAIGDGAGQFPRVGGQLAEQVKRWRPALWRGQRSGSPVFGVHRTRPEDEPWAKPFY